MSADEERIALFLDYENLAIGARENLGGMAFDLKPVADALAERGRVVVRRAYADWLKFAEDGRMLTRHHVELIEIPQRMGSVRKNAADIKMAVDALEMCFERDYITTFVLGTGDSDFTPLVHKLREHNKQVIGLGVQMSTSALLPPACDEFLFYERLEGVEVPAKGRRTIVARGRGRGRRPQVGDVGEVEVEAEAEVENDAGETAEPTAPATLEGVERLISQTLSGLERSSGTVRASSLKRAVLRKESTFSEADYGFRGFTELLRSLSERGVIELVDSSSPGDPDVQFPIGGNLGEVGVAFELLASTVESLVKDGVGTPLSGLKTQLRRRQPDFSEKRFGFGGFLQFAKAAVARGVVAMAWNDEADDYLLTAVTGRPTFELPPADAAPAPAEAGEAAEAGGAPVEREVPRGTADDDDTEADTRRRNRSGRGGRGRNRNGAGDAAVPAPAGRADERTEPAEEPAVGGAVDTQAHTPAEPTDTAGPDDSADPVPAEPTVAAGVDAPAPTGTEEDTAADTAGTDDTATEAAPSDAGLPDAGPAPADAEPVAEAAPVAEPAAEEAAPKRRRRTTKAKAEAEPTAEGTTDAAPARAPRTRRASASSSAAADAPAEASAAGTTTRRRRTTKAAEAGSGEAGVTGGD